MPTVKENAESIALEVMYKGWGLGDPNVVSMFVGDAAPSDPRKCPAFKAIVPVIEQALRDCGVKDEDNLEKPSIVNDDKYWHEFDAAGECMQSEVIFDCLRSWYKTSDKKERRAAAARAVQAIARTGRRLDEYLTDVELFDASEFYAFLSAALVDCD